MTKPTCCGKRCFSYTIQHGHFNFRLKHDRHVYHWYIHLEHGFRCRVCGRIRVPPILTEAEATRDGEAKAQYQREMATLREEGLAFDASLS